MNIDELRLKINALYKKLHTWQLVGDELKINKGLAYRIAKTDYEPHEPHLRELLDLPILMPAPVCPRCGVVHVTKRCTANDKPVTQRWVRVLGHAGYAEIER